MPYCIYNLQNTCILRLQVTQSDSKTCVIIYYDSESMFNCNNFSGIGISTYPEEQNKNCLMMLNECLSIDVLFSWGLLGYITVGNKILLSRTVLIENNILSNHLSALSGPWSKVINTGLTVMEKQLSWLMSHQHWGLPSIWGVGDRAGSDSS